MIIEITVTGILGALGCIGKGALAAFLCLQEISNDRQHDTILEQIKMIRNEIQEQRKME